jgi:hypothetical protein
VVRALGAVHAPVVAPDRRVAPDVLQPVGLRLALLVHRCEVLGVVLALREQVLVLVGLARQHALVRRRRVR